MQDFIEIIKTALQRIPKNNRPVIGASLYQASVLSLSEAAKILEMPVAEFMEVLKVEGIPIFRGA